MAWLNELDNTEPTDLELVAEGAERFRELKRSLIERFGTMFRNFPGEDPTRPDEAMLFPVAGAEVGTEDQRPATPEREGHVWFSTDSGRVYFGGRDGSWKLVPVTGPSQSSDPLVPLFSVGTSYVDPTGATAAVRRVLFGTVINGMTDGSGVFSVNLNEIPGDFQASDAIPLQGSVTPIIQAGVLDDMVAGYFSGTIPTSNRLLFNCYRLRNGAFGSDEHRFLTLPNAEVSFYYMVPFTSPPPVEDEILDDYYYY